MIRRSKRHSYAKGSHAGVWDDKLVEVLKDLAAKRYTARQIGLELNMTRSQVLGKAHRMGLKINGHQPKPPKQRMKRIALSKDRPAQAQPRQFTLERDAIPENRPSDVARKTLAELEPDDCRFPVGHVGEKSFGFCAAPKVEGLSYCKEHAARCLTPVVSKALRDKMKDASVASDRSADLSKLVVAGE